jgi:hypothetical protein
VSVAVIAAYWSVLSVGFVSDDFLILGRLRALGGLEHASAYFGLRHFDYYRPLAFLSYALDWNLWEGRASGYHLTSLGLHALNTLLVFALSRRLMAAWSSAIAAALFAVHPSSHEAVFWMSARFDLLAASWFLIGMLALRTSRARADVCAALAFLAAVLSKESAVAFPAASLAYALLLQHARPGRMVRQLAYFAGTGGVYIWMRHAAGLASTGGTARVPKLAALAVLVAALVYASHLGWPRVSSAVRARMRLVTASALLLLLAAGLLAQAHTTGPALRKAFTTIGFAAVHLLSPVALDSLAGTMPWWMWPAGWLALAGAVAAVATARARIADAQTPAFLAVFLIAALVPVSSMTEGTRYLYLACAPAAMLAGWLWDRIPAKALPIASAVLAVVLVVNVWQVRAKGADWAWASGMAEAAATTVSDALGNRCGGHDVALATAPVRVRGVYSNLNIESFGWLADCTPASLRTLVRVGHDDPQIAAAWEAPARLRLRVPEYRGGFVTSRDLRTFDVSIDRMTPTRVTNTLGAFDAQPAGGGLDMRQTVSPGPAGPDVSWFFFSQGRLHPIPPGPRAP